MQNMYLFISVLFEERLYWLFLLKRSGIVNAQRKYINRGKNKALICSFIYRTLQNLVLKPWQAVSFSLRWLCLSLFLSSRCWFCTLPFQANSIFLISMFLMASHCSPKYINTIQLDFLSKAWVYSANKVEVILVQWLCSLGQLESHFFHKDSNSLNLFFLTSSPCLYWSLRSW